MAERVVLKHNARDRRTGRAYNAGTYEVAEGAATRRNQIDRAFATRVLTEGLAVEYAANATDDAAALADAEGIDLASVSGSGKGGRVGVNDVRAVIAERDAAAEGDAGDAGGNGGDQGPAGPIA